jgi:uncharacterized pyridoxamine 5'-phosphate oxidase family protein
MTKEEIIVFMNANPACHIATVENDQPRVRGVLLFKADEKGIIFHTAKFKDLHKQLIKNPDVEMCFNNFISNTQVRVRGKARLIDDLGLKHEITNHPSRVFLKPWIEKGGLDFLSVFRIEECKACVWTMQTNFEATKFTDLL